MSVFTRDALEGSPLADLHTIAGELGLDGFRRLRKADLVDRILELSGGESAGGAQASTDADADTTDAKPKRSRGGRGRGRKADADPDATGADADAAADDAGDKDDDEAEARPARRSRGGRGRGRSAAAASDEPKEQEADEAPRGRGRRAAGGEDEEAQVAEGVVEVLGNGSGFLRVSPPEPSDDDIYISAAQVRRCELVSGDRITGPVRPPRRSERYPSLIRIDQINDRPADEVAEGTPFEELPAAFPTERFALGSDDATLKAIEWLTPIGRGSRVTITGPARAGKTEALQRLAAALNAQEGVEVSLALVGVRPEETTVAPEGISPVAALTFAASADAQSQALDRAIDAGRRVAARGGHAVVLVDSLDGVHPPAARKALAAARAIVDGGSLTVIATASAPLGGETTVIALDESLTAAGRFPAVDLFASGTLKPELLVGKDADLITEARAKALDQG